MNALKTTGTRATVDILYIEGMKWNEYPIPPTESMQMVEDGRTMPRKKKREARNSRRDLEQRDIKGEVQTMS